ncbi:MAG: Flp pilus assembly complex ATPase component TadA [Actinobacteria bacterium]|nr:Flp pilus assembly complex ATPase component TadA [Actinomycetota bacterium]
MNADPNPQADRPALDGLALFRVTPKGDPGAARQGRVRSSFRLNPESDRPEIRLVVSEPDRFDPVPESALPPTVTPAFSIDWKLVAAFRGQAAEALTQRLGQATSRQAQQELGRAIITELLDAAADDQVTAGRKTWTRAEQEALAQAIFDSLFRLGRLQPLVDDDRVENIIILGHDRVWLELIDGTLVSGPAVADTDEELIEFISFLASREGSARSFSEAHPSLDLRLADGSRLSATNWVTSTPSIVIRRHRLVDVTLDDLVRLGTLSPVMATFLKAAVRAELSIVVAGAQGAGKTTLLRALCNEIDPLEQLATFEDPAELFLDELRGRHAVVHAFEARHGSGEVGADGRPAGEFGLDMALPVSQRKNVARQIVGEVRGPEAWLMIKAMESGSGSLSTTHAASAADAMDKLVTCCMEAGRHVSSELAARKLGRAIDLVVHIRLDNTTDADGTKHRRRTVSEIVAVGQGEAELGYALTQVFSPVPNAPATPTLLPDHLRSLARHGFDLDAFRAQATGATR